MSALTRPGYGPTFAVPLQRNERCGERAGGGSRGSAIGANSKARRTRNGAPRRPRPASERATLLNATSSRSGLRRETRSRPEKEQIGSSCLEGRRPPCTAPASWTSALWLEPAELFAGPTKQAPLKPRGRQRGLEARIGFEPTYGGFANRCLTTWLPRRYGGLVAHLGQESRGQRLAPMPHLARGAAAEAQKPG